MMPLIFADDGEVNIIRSIGGTEEIRHHLNNLGFVVGGTVQKRASPSTNEWRRKL